MNDMNCFGISKKTSGNINKKCKPAMPRGTSSFEKIINNNLYYVDKTGLIEELIESSDEVTLFTRPRRFGKTVTMQMLESFFNIEKDSKRLFAGLKISKNHEICTNYMNQYPTIFITLKEVFGNTYDGALNILEDRIKDLYSQYDFLDSSTELSINEHNFFTKVQSGILTETEILRALAILVNMLFKHYHKPVILLIDEYDVPLAKASELGYYDRMLNSMRTFMQVLKDNNALEFAVATGCLRITKESIFTGANNFYVNSITCKHYNEFFGFTDSEVKQLLKDTNALTQYDEIKEWYDGYNFGGTEIYCPWDVIYYMNDFLNGEPNIPQCYWSDTGDTDVLREFVNRYSDAIYDEIEILMSGATIQKQIREDLTYDLLHSSEDNFWSMLFMTGYLTSDSTKFLDTVSLRIPNKELNRIYNETIQQWFENSMEGLDRSILLNALWSKNTEVFAKELSRILITTISFHDYKEDFYHAFLAGIFTGLKYQVKSNTENGEGRSDVVIIDRTNFRVVIFEVKHSSKRSDMEHDCDRALAQIIDRQYAVEFEDEFDEILCYGISFYKKRCLVKTLIED